MASTQRFEGPNLETLLGEVRTVAGSDVRIVEANRLLRGGIAGFFAKERFEVVIELPDPDATPAAASAHANEQMHLLRLADAASDTERRELAELRCDKPPSVLDAWAQDARDTDLVHESVSTPHHAPAPTTFDHVLDRIAGISTLTEPNYRAPSRYREQLAAPIAAQIEAPIAEGIEERIEPRIKARISATIAEQQANPDELNQPKQPNQPKPAKPAKPAHGGRSGLRNQLLGLGLPKRWVDDADLTGEPVDVIARLVAVHAPQPRRPGSAGIIAIVGDAADAFRVAHRVAEELGLYAGDIYGAAMSRRPSFLAPTQWLPGPDVVLEHRRTWLTRSGITLVVLGAGTGRDAQQWCREMLHVVRPQETWAVVEASRKPEDIEAWAAKVGNVDALALCRADESVSPAAVLAAGIPVSRIDNRPATPTGWGLLLADRLSPRDERRPSAA